MKKIPGLLITCGLLVACAETPPPKTVAAADPGAVEEPRAAPARPGPAENTASVSISESIRKACGLPETDAHFDYNSSNVTPQADRVLSGLATCFTVGPLKGRGMKLVGHADPRGESEYNLLLGGRRADHVSAALSEKGLAESRMATSSRGEMDATGEDESGWARDRKVEVMLAD